MSLLVHRMIKIVALTHEDLPEKPAREARHEAEDGIQCNSRPATNQHSSDGYLGLEDAHPQPVVAKA